jgi:BAG domain/Ubiquitin family
MANLAKASLGAEDEKTMATSISTVLSRVLKSFNATITRNELHMHQDQVPRSLWDDELGRLRVWAANIGAHQTGLSSLDYRLRDASHIKAQIVRLLEGLARKFRHLEEVLDEDPEELDKLDEEADLDHGGVTEIQQIYKALTENINLLFRMSMLIRRPAHHDRLLGTRREDAVFFEPFDRQHVVEKFPRANTEIANRLGAAISRRRAYLRYRDRHHAKLGKGITEIEDDKTVHASTELSDTIATEFKEPNSNPDRMETESSYSQTSYAPTLLEGRSTMTVPSPPKGSADGQPFECPYCFFITTVKDSRSWARHVFKDIMPYVCIFTDCSIPNQLYDSRRDWYRHLVNDHHGWVKDDAQAECPLCQEINLPAPKLERHLGRHLEELALFALPRTDADEDLDSNESSHHSSRASETPAESHPSPHDSTHHATHAEDLTSDSLPPEPRHSSSGPQASIRSTYGDPDEEAPDTLLIRCKHQTHELHFKPYAISDGLLLVSDIRNYAAEKLGRDPRQVRLLYKGITLKDDSLKAKAYNLKQHSEIMCVISEIEAMDGAVSDYSGSGDDPTDPSSPLGKVNALSSAFHTRWLTECTQFIMNPPSDPKTRDLERAMISEGVMAQILLKADNIEIEGDREARVARKQLVNEVNATLKRLDAVGKRQS